MGETEVFLSGAGLMPGGVAGTCRVEGGDPNCKDQDTMVMQDIWFSIALDSIYIGCRVITTID